MPFYCRTCGLHNVRISHWRSSDWVRLLALQYPVRCRECRERGHVFILEAVKIWREGELRRRKRSRDRKSTASQ
jgi:hypothetical protein